MRTRGGWNSDLLHNSQQLPNIGRRIHARKAALLEDAKRDLVGCSTQTYTMGFHRTRFSVFSEEYYDLDAAIA